MSERAVVPHRFRQPCIDPRLRLVRRLEGDRSSSPRGGARPRLFLGPAFDRVLDAGTDSETATVHSRRSRVPSGRAPGAARSCILHQGSRIRVLPRTQRGVEAEGCEVSIMKRLVTFLGMGDYDQAIYTWNGQRSTATRFVQCAVAELLEAKDVVVLATSDAKEKHGETLEAELRRQGCSVRILPVPTPLEDLQGHFTPLVEALRSDHSIVMDITHGFRAQPFFAGAALACLRTAGRSDSAERTGCDEVRIVYGAHDKAVGGGPILDLSPALDLMDWARALGTFVTTGHGGDVGGMTSRLGNRVRHHAIREGVPAQNAPALAPLGKAIEEFSLNIALVRTGRIILDQDRGSAAHLIATIRRHRTDIERHLPAVGLILDRLSGVAEGLRAQDFGTRSGRVALANLARYYLELERYPEAVATIREYWVTWYATAACPEAVNPGPKCDYPGRDRAVRLWRNTDNELFRKVTDARNDILHAGYKNDPGTARTFVDTCRNLVSEVADHAKTTDGTLRIPVPDKETAVFVNLSNHPHVHWEEAQLAEARALARRIITIDFPTVPPEADTEQVEHLCEDVLKQVPQGATHAMVQGEFTLTLALVRELQARVPPVVCLAGTRSRAPADGQDAQPFRFTRFREYPVRK